jgi:hypothetical protein
MKKMLLVFLLMLSAAVGYSQITYYWVGGAGVSPANVSTAANWNTSISGGGSTRPSSTGATDILVFDGTNTGGPTPTTGMDSVNLNSSITCAQMKFVNNANIVFIRSTTGTSTITISGDAGEDFVIESGSMLSLSSSIGSTVITMGTATTGRVSGTLNMVTSLQARIGNLTAAPGSMIFTSGSSLHTNITSASSAYAFGNNTQSTEKWVSFQSGSHLYYEGGFSPNGSGTLFSAIDMQSGSTWHHRATNAITGAGNFFNRKTYGNVIVENNAVLTALGPIYGIENLTINSGSVFNTNSSGQTVVLGNLIADGDLSSGAGTNALVLGGNTTQTVSGSGTINVGSLIVADRANVVLNKNITVSNSTTVYGKINFNTFQINGAGSFTAAANTPSVSLTGNAIAGNYFVGPVTGFSSSYVGLAISGTGIAPNTNVVSYSTALDTIYISKPVLSTATGASFAFGSQSATLETANSNGFDAASGSVVLAGNQLYQNGINYIIDAATAKPFGISTGSTAPHIVAGSLVFNAAATTNTGVNVSSNLQINSGKLTIRPLDTVELLTDAILTGTFSATNYIVTDVVTATGVQGIFRRDGITGSSIFPIGTATAYMPATLNPTTASDFATAVFQGITNDGTPNGTPQTSLQKQTKVDAVWNINRISGSGSTALQLGWAQALEGSTFITLPNTDIGIIVNQNPNWSLPVAPGDNTLNTASGNFTAFGAFGVGAQPPSQPFTFNALPVKNYGDPDFNPGAISLNTTNPIIYTSSNPAVATIVAGNIHITGTGTSQITATQASDGFYPAANVAQTLTVNKANLTIKADDKTKPQGDPNPPLTVTYTGFVNGETATVLTTAVSVTTTATTASPSGTYPIVPAGAAALNYNISFVNGTMTVTPRQNQTITFNAFATKTYGNADFAVGATSSNGSIPVTYTSSNPAVATIVGNNIHIVSAGTSTITASQAGNTLYFPAPDVTRVLTVNKANLTVKAVDTTKLFGEVNPPLRLIYTGFVLNETIANLSTQPTATTTATTNSAPGYYPITVGGGVAANYNFVYTDARLTILPASGPDQSHVQAYLSSSTMLTVKIYAANPDLADVILYDMTGKPVVTKNAFLPKGFVTVTISVSGLASGLYTVVVNGQTVKMKKNISIVH